MQLHEAVKRARQDLKLSQKKLSELAGVQRRQLATLESGGNVTLATLRKVLAQLPNLESFSLDTVTVDVAVRPDTVEQLKYREAMDNLADAFTAIAKALKAGRIPGPVEFAALQRINEGIAEESPAFGSEEQVFMRDFESEDSIAQIFADDEESEELRAALEAEGRAGAEDGEEADAAADEEEA